MAFKYEDSGIAASVYLGLYVILLSFSIFITIKKGIKTVFSCLLFFSAIRLGGQFCGVVFAKVGLVNHHWLVAYVILGAEGYFALIMASLYFIMFAQTKNHGKSWLKDSIVTNENNKILNNPTFKFITRILLLRLLYRGILQITDRGSNGRMTWKGLFHTILLPANALIIIGGALLANVSPGEYNSEHDKILRSKILRTIGQSLFLILTIVVISLVVYVNKVERVKNWIIKTVYLASPFLLVRGIFGILSIYIDEMNYFMESNYTLIGGIDSKLIIYEYVLSTTMEFIASLCFYSNYFTNSQEQSINDVETNIDVHEHDENIESSEAEK